MKKILLLSALILFSCSKDSEEGAVIAPGDEIIGTYSLLQPQSKWMGRNMGSTDVIVFESTKKGSYTRNFRNSQDVLISEKTNFDWSFDGARWKVKDINNWDWEITFFDGIYEMKRGSSDYYKLVFKK
jgi:hypothetical protein